MLRRALEASSTHGVVVWMDADALVVDQEKSLDFFLSQDRKLQLRDLFDCVDWRADEILGILDASTKGLTK